MHLHRGRPPSTLQSLFMLVVSKPDADRLHFPLTISQRTKWQRGFVCLLVCLRNGWTIFNPNTSHLDRVRKTRRGQYFPSQVKPVTSLISRVSFFLFPSFASLLPPSFYLRCGSHQIKCPRKGNESEFIQIHIVLQNNVTLLPYFTACHMCCIFVDFIIKLYFADTLHTGKEVNGNLLYHLPLFVRVYACTSTSVQAVTSWAICENTHQSIFQKV